jgi:hypothetical protein
MPRQDCFSDLMRKERKKDKTMAKDQSTARLASVCAAFVCCLLGTQPTSSLATDSPGISMQELGEQIAQKCMNRCCKQSQLCDRSCQDCIESCCKRTLDGFHCTANESACLPLHGSATGNTVATPKRLGEWPEFVDELAGGNEVRVQNPNDFSVKVGLRQQNKGKDFSVGANGTASVLAPDGRYDIYFQYSADPEGLYQGDSFTLAGNGVEIKIVKVVGGNYGIRKVK